MLIGVSVSRLSLCFFCFFVCVLFVIFDFMCTITLYLIVHLDQSRLVAVYLVSFSSIHLFYSFLDLMSVYVFAGFSFKPAICAVVISSVFK